METAGIQLGSAAFEADLSGVKVEAIVIITIIMMMTIIIIIIIMMMMILLLLKKCLAYM